MQFSENQTKVLVERFFMTKADGTKENWTELSRRVAASVTKATAEFGDRDMTAEEKEYFDMIFNCDVVPATPILMNAGTSNQAIFSCFVSEIKDNLESIYEELGTSAKIFAGAGGVGYYFGNLRPEGSKVSNRGLSSGVLSFMELFNTSCGIIKIGSGSRRGAMLAAISVDHPEILDFIKCKSKAKKLTNFNISVILTDDFMAAVRMDGTYEVKQFKHDTGAPKTLSARKVFDTLVNRAWNNGEPGVLFMDTANKFNPTPKLGKYISTNPCFDGDMRVLTTTGYKKFKDLIDQKNIQVIDRNGRAQKSRVFLSGEKPTVKMTLSNGTRIIVTPDHRFLTAAGHEITAQDSKDLRIRAYYTPSKIEDFDNEMVKLGFIQGDGNLSRLNSKEHKGVEINIGKDDKDVAKFFGYDFSDFSAGGRVVYTTEFTERLKKLEFDRKTLATRKFPKTYRAWSKKGKLSFLRGVYSANGCVIEGRRVSFKTISADLVKDLRAALGEFGITTTVSTNKPKAVRFNNGVYMCKESYDVVINQYNSIIQFTELIGFIHEYKRAALAGVIRDRSPKVTSVRPAGVRKVYDFSMSSVHWGVVEGVIAHNCGEVVGIDGSVCCLAHVNLSTLVKSDKTFDMVEFERRVRAGIRFLDNCIDINKYPAKKYKDVSMATRTIGLGIMGFADVLAQMDIPYGSERCFEMIATVGRALQKFSHDESFQICQTRGNYPAFEGKTPLRRNANTNTVAPTGTTAMIADSSYAFEPFFALAYTKNCMDGEKLFYGNKYLEHALKAADLPAENIQAVLKYANDHGTLKGVDPKLIPEYIVDNFRTAHDIPWKTRVKIQAEWQKYIDLCISSTINMDEHATKEDVAEMYIMSWELGLKGLTFYRNNSRSEQVLNVGVKVKNTWTCDGCGLIVELDADVDPETCCVKCPKCGNRSCA